MTLGVPAVWSRPLETESERYFLRLPHKTEIVGRFAINIVESKSKFGIICVSTTICYLPCIGCVVDFGGLIFQCKAKSLLFGRFFGS